MLLKTKIIKKSVNISHISKYLEETISLDIIQEMILNHHPDKILTI